MTDTERKAQMRAYYLAHREKLVAYQRKFRAEHPDYIREYNRTHHDQIRATRRAYYAKHKKEIQKHRHELYLQKKGQNTNGEE